MKITKQMRLHGELLQEFAKFLDTSFPEYWPDFLEILRYTNRDPSAGIVHAAFAVHRNEISEIHNSIKKQQSQNAPS